MEVSDFILDFLEKKKVKHVFTLTGGAISFILDAFSRNKKIKYIPVTHEQSASIMADSYSRMGVNFSCSMATSGPGATNLITGIACSYFDSIPSLHITGQVNTWEQQGFNSSTRKVRQVGFQETDIVSIAKPITKFSYKLKKASEIKYVLEKAFHIATSGRPGPVLIDIPMDFQRKKLNFSKLKNFVPNKIKVDKGLKKKILIIEKYLNKSKRPVIILGGGVKYGKAKKNVNKLLKFFNIPIVTTWSGVDLIDHSLKKYIGSIGVYGSRAANFTIQNSDLFLCLGSRLDTRVTGGSPKSFAKGAKKIMVDIDKNELSKNRGLNIDIKIHSDCKKFIDVYLKYKKDITYKREWLDQCDNWKKIYKYNFKNLKKQKKINPYYFMNYLSNILKKDSVLISSTGAHLTWTLQSFKIKYGQKLFSAFGNSPMGYALPASIGASISENKKKIICIDGDGSLLLSLQDLSTVKKLNLPIKIFILNNNGYGIIKQFQELYLEKRFQATGGEVSIKNFKKISKAFDINYSQITNHQQLLSLSKILSSKKPEIIELMLNKNQKIIPKLVFGKPIEDLSPLLPRKEFMKNIKFLNEKKTLNNR